MKKKNSLSPVFQLLPNSFGNQPLASVKCLCSTDFSRAKALTVGETLDKLIYKLILLSHKD